MPLASATYRIIDASLSPDGEYVMPSGVRTETWAMMNARWCRNHQKTDGTIGSSFHPRKRTLAVWLSKDHTELFAKVFFADSELGWRAAAQVEKGFWPACSLSFLPLTSFGGPLTDDDIRKIAKGLPDGHYVIEDTPRNWWKTVAVNEISLVPKGQCRAAVLLDWEEGRPVWKPMWRGKAG
jgi:hypothetical protein